ncbi:MAG: hypothetical protein LAO76_27380 [Acidobacteriia bacterium]|nr:hypothetical protein [Terriglobia bacterium]
MTLQLTRHLEKTILVSIPVLFEDAKCRPYKLVGAELHGLWLESDELTKRLLPDHKKAYASAASAVFIPFSQIAGVIVATSPAVPPVLPEGQDEEPSGGRITRPRDKRESHDADDDEPRTKRRK